MKIEGIALFFFALARYTAPLMKEIMYYEESYSCLCCTGWIVVGNLVLDVRKYIMGLN